MNERSLQLEVLFIRLSRPNADGETYSTDQAPEFTGCRIGMDRFGYAAVLLPASFDPREDKPAPLLLPNFSFRPRCMCNIQPVEGPVSHEVLAVVKCKTDDIALRRVFFASVQGLLDRLPSYPTEFQIANGVQSIIELFRSTELPPRKTIQGLWSELFLMTKATHVRQAVAAWRQERHTLHDFAAGYRRLEVKSVASDFRQHHFSLGQLDTRNGDQVIVVSFKLKQSIDGPTVIDLWETLQHASELTDDLLIRLNRNVGESLGRDWQLAQHVGFDSEAASLEMRLYDANNIPKVDFDLPPEVTDVKFKAELTDVPAMSTSKAAGLGGLFKAFFA